MWISVRFLCFISCKCGNPWVCNLATDDQVSIHGVLLMCQKEPALTILTIRKSAENFSHSGRVDFSVPCNIVRWHPLWDPPLPPGPNPNKAPTATFLKKKKKKRSKTPPTYGGPVRTRLPQHGHNLGKVKFMTLDPSPPHPIHKKKKKKKKTKRTTSVFKTKTSCENLLSYSPRRSDMTAHWCDDVWNVRHTKLFFSGRSFGFSSFSGSSYDIKVNDVYGNCSAFLSQTLGSDSVCLRNSFQMLQKIYLQASFCRSVWLAEPNNLGSSKQTRQLGSCLKAVVVVAFVFVVVHSQPKPPHGGSRGLNAKKRSCSFIPWSSEDESQLALAFHHVLTVRFFADRGEAGRTLGHCCPWQQITSPRRQVSNNASPAIKRSVLQGFVPKDMI